jgi:autophagy-related protein 101
LSELLAEGVLNIAESLSRGDLYVPHLVNYEELDLIFETEFPDVQPFLFRIMHRTDEPARPSASSAFRKLIRDTLSL